ncbi:MAG: LysE family transporter [Candidatus Altiarchaeota archaeon]|nr:LysE family transporter [Candidatus Altiarchaeota archaeon]
MDYLNAFFLLGLGFLVGLSGAVMPGPLLFYTINESLEKGKWTGLRVIAGHAVVESLVFLLIAFGLVELLDTEGFARIAGLVGGLALIAMGAHSLYSLKGSSGWKRPDRPGARHGLVVGGIVFTAFNPGFPVWWITAGTNLLLEGLRVMQYEGMLLVFLGHWVADAGWFLLVSVTASTGSRYLLGKGWYKKVRACLSFVLFLIGAYFISTVF